MNLRCPWLVPFVLCVLVSTTARAAAPDDIADVPAVEPAPSAHVDDDDIADVPAVEPAPSAHIDDAVVAAPDDIADAPAVEPPPSAHDDDDEELVVRHPPRQRWALPWLSLAAGGTALVAGLGAPALAVLIAQSRFLPHQVSNALSFGPLVAPALAASVMYFGGDDLDVKATAAAGYGGALAVGALGAVTGPIVLVVAVTNGLVPGSENVDAVDVFFAVLIGVSFGGAAGWLVGEVAGSAAGPIIASAIRTPDDDE